MCVLRPVSGLRAAQVSIADDTPDVHDLQEKTFILAHSCKGLSPRSLACRFQPVASNCSLAQEAAGGSRGRNQGSAFPQGHVSCDPASCHWA